MKKNLFLAAIIILITISLSFVSSFSAGYSDGYCEGYKSVKAQYTVCPVSPVAPVPPIGQNTYKGGYNLGFIDGRSYAQ